MQDPSACQSRPRLGCRAGTFSPSRRQIRSIGVTEVSYYRWRREFGGLKSDQVKRMKELEAENARLRRAVADLTLDKLILKEAPSGNWQAPRVAAPASIMFGSL